MPKKLSNFWRWMSNPKQPGSNAINNLEGQYIYLVENLSIFSRQQTRADAQAWLSWHFNADKNNPLALLTMSPVYQ